MTKRDTSHSYLGKNPPRSAGTRSNKPVKPARNVGKRPKNLTLDAEAVTLGEAYGRRYGTNVSQIVNSFLKALPPTKAANTSAEMLPGLSPLTRRLYGIAAGGTTSSTDHRAHLLKKYGSEKKGRR